MGLSSRLFILSADETLHALAGTAFMRMLRHEEIARVPAFAGQRVRQASAVVELLNGSPLRMVHCTFSILEFGADGMLETERLNTQQLARLDDLMKFAKPTQGKDSPVIDATARFVARGGSWVPDERLLRRIEAATLGQVSCPRVRVVR